MRSEKIVFLDLNKPIKFLKNKYLFDPCWCDIHVHQEVEFIYVNDGYIECTVDDKKFIAKKGDIVFFNSFVPHETDDHSNNFLFNFNIPAFSVGQIKYLRNFINQSHVKHYVFTKDDECYEELKQELVQIVSIFEFSDVYYNYYVIAHIFMITALLHRIGFMGDFYDWVNYWRI